MMQVTQKDLLTGVHLTAVHTTKFKTSVMGISLLTPIQADTASLHALIPAVLRRGTQSCPTMEALSATLDGLYGGAMEPIVRKKGAVQSVGFMASLLDDAYTPDGSQTLEPAAQLLGEMLLQPTLEEGRFRSDYVTGEKEQLIQRIRAQVNEKRSYSVQRLIELTCDQEPAGVDKLGDEASVSAITAESLWTAYQHLLRTGTIALYYCGSADLERVEAAFRSAFAPLLAEPRQALPQCQVKAQPDGQPRLVEEAMDVTQGKLAISFRTAGITAHSPAYPALVVVNAVFGGTVTAKLFLNVREKLSLCYYASSMIDKLTGLMIVSSGIEFDKFDQAKTEILAQLEACCTGDMEEWELVGAKQSVISSLRTAMDSQGRLEDFWLGQTVAGLDYDPLVLANQIKQVTKDQVIEVARQLSLDTIYFLKGKEEV